MMHIFLLNLIVDRLLYVYLPSFFQEIFINFVLTKMIMTTTRVFVQV